MAESAAGLTLSLDAGPGADEQDQAMLSSRLRQHLLDRDVDRVEFVRAGTAPEGAKGDPITLAALAITLAPAALTGLITMVQSWLTRHERASVTVESGGEKLTITGTPSAGQQQAISAFLDRHKT